MNPREGKEIRPFPVESSMLPLLFPVSVAACFEAGMYVRGLKPIVTENLIRQAASIGGVRDAFQTVVLLVDAMETASEEAKHSIRRGALYSERAISVHAKEKKIEIPTVHSMDVRKLIGKAGEFLVSKGQGDFSHYDAAQSLIDNAKMVTESMSEDGKSKFEYGARLIAYCIAEVAANTEPDFREQVGPRRSAFSVEPVRLTPEQLQEIIRKAKEQDSSI